MAPGSGRRPGLAAVVLCGGGSSRMGRTKALLPFGNEVLLARVVRLCAEACGPIVVVAGEGQDIPPLPGAPRIVRDARPGRGPLEGLAAGLAACATPAAFCVPCDVPFLRPALAGLLHDALGEAAGARAVAGGFPQPLVAVYRTDLAAGAERLLEEGRRRAEDVVGDGPVVLVPERLVREVDPDLASFRGLNTPEEYAAALRENGGDVLH